MARPVLVVRERARVPRPRRDRLLQRWIRARLSRMRSELVSRECGGHSARDTVVADGVACELGQWIPHQGLAIRRDDVIPPGRCNRPADPERRTLGRLVLWRYNDVLPIPTHQVRLRRFEEEPRRPAGPEATKQAAVRSCIDRERPIAPRLVRNIVDTPARAARAAAVRARAHRDRRASRARRTRQRLARVVPIRGPAARVARAAAATARPRPTGHRKREGPEQQRRCRVGSVHGQASFSPAASEPAAGHRMSDVEKKGRGEMRVCLGAIRRPLDATLP